VSRIEAFPHDEMTRRAAVMLEAFKGALVPGEPNTRAIALVTRYVFEEHKDLSGIAATGYGYNSPEARSQMVADLLSHARSILRELGKDVQIVPLAPPAPELVT
jgi:hypothetical protein